MHRPRRISGFHPPTSRCCALSLLLLASAAACAYPRFSTPLNPIPDSRVELDSWPDGLYSVQLIGANIPAAMRSGLPWDDDGSAADPFVRMYVDGRLLFESKAQENSRNPRWNSALPRNARIPAGAELRLELWDRDSTVSADPIARLQRRGLPLSVARGARTQLELDGRARIELIADVPRAHRGSGLSVELRADGLLVFAVEPFSPAARAAIEPGDSILAIGGQAVAEVGAERALGMLSLAAERGHALRVLTAKSARVREVILDRGYTWLVM